MKFQDRYNKPDSAIPPDSENLIDIGFLNSFEISKISFQIRLWDFCGISLVFHSQACILGIYSLKSTPNCSMKLA